MIYSISLFTLVGTYEQIMFHKNFILLKTICLNLANMTLQSLSYVIEYTIIVGDIKITTYGEYNEKYNL